MLAAFPDDVAQQFLVRHLKRTEQVFMAALQEIDRNAHCEIFPAADLCLPHDVMRLCGGFATGCYVRWDCDTPIIPVDTNVNIDTSSIFWLDDFPTLTEDHFTSLRSRIERDSSYEWNFHKGNHFISLTVRKSDGRPALVVHSNEKEFKYQYNGLSPSTDNWYADSVQTYNVDNRFIRLLTGEKAILFFEIAKLMEPFNITRHRFIATQLLGGIPFDDEHHHHYYMPDSASVAMGCFIQDSPEVVPIFSAPGEDIALFFPAYGGKNEIEREGIKHLLVPHGWGKTVKGSLSVETSSERLLLNGRSYPNKELVSIGKDPDLMVRNFSPDPQSMRSMFQQMSWHTPGTVVDLLVQVAWFNKDGFKRSQSGFE